MTVATRTDLSSIVARFNGVLSTHDGQELSRKEVWDFSLLQSDRPSESTWIPRTLEDFKVLRVKLERIRALSSALRALSESFEDELPELKTQVDNAARYWFLQRLPDEILIIILGHAVTELKDVSNLSLVCPRFRFIISSPRIWAGITLKTSMTSRQMSTVVDRSHGLLLTAIIERVRHENAISDLLTHANALAELAMGVYAWEYDQEKLERLHLPHLRVLSMYEGDMHLYKSWTMPQLRRLNADFIPLPIPNTSIVVCNLNLDSYYASRAGDLLYFLASVPFLEELQLQILEWPKARTEAVVLPKLRSMTLELCRTSQSSGQKKTFLDTLSLKSLSDLSITCEFPNPFAKYRYSSSKEQLEVDSGYLCDEAFLLRFIARQQSLRRLEILFRCWHIPYPNWSVAVLLNHFASRFIDLQSSVPHLNARLCAGHTPDITWDAVQKRCTEAPVLSLSINNTGDLTVDDLRTALQGALSKSSVQKVDIASCPNIDEDELRVLFRDAEVVEYRDTPCTDIVL